MWDSPIKQVSDELNIVMEGEIMKAVQRFGINVDIEELIKALAYDRNQYEKGYDDAEAQHTWIPCSERLPEECVPVLVCNIEGKVYIRQINWISRGRAQIPYWSQNSTGIIAWQPLPAPFKQKE